MTTVCAPMWSRPALDACPSTSGSHAPRFPPGDAVVSARSSPSNHSTRTGSSWSIPSRNLIAERASSRPLSAFSLRCSALPASPSLASGSPKAPPKTAFCAPSPVQKHVFRSPQSCGSRTSNPGDTTAGTGPPRRSPVWTIAHRVREPARPNSRLPRWPTSRTWASAATARSSAETHRWRACDGTQPDLAYRRQHRETARRHEGIPARHHRQLFEEEP